ncbi:MAG: cob(I)yrinic acid a,c-diamide adenosyltransferase [Bacteroidaceae bacterium]
MKKSNLYTRTGDDGTTSLVGGVRVEKTHVRLEAYGTIDELNSQLGLLLAYLPPSTPSSDRFCVVNFQNKLFAIGASLASPEGQPYAKPLTPLDIKELEVAIDVLDADLPPLHQFILPGGTRAAAICHVCRTVCRRAERRMLGVREQGEVDPLALVYINRLSDYLFALARKLNFRAKKQEINSRPL